MLQTGKCVRIGAAALLLMLMTAACALAVPAGRLTPISARPNQKLAFRSGPGTKYTELFSIARGAVTDFVIFQKEKGGSAMWGMVEFNSGYGRYRAYTGMKRIDVNEKRVPMGNIEGKTYRIGARDARAYWGPGKQYVAHENKVPAGTKVTVFHEENGYVMADFVMPDAKPNQYEKEKQQITRAWIRAGDLSGYHARTQEN